MTKCFVDTSAFVALYHRNDTSHEQAKLIWLSLKKASALLYTTRDIISETITFDKHFVQAGFEVIQPESSP
jgi:predicted nucleic acid-binding protein